MRQAYGLKLDLQQRTRSDVLYYASHGCEKSDGVGQTGEGGTVPGDNPAEGVAQRAGLRDAAAVKRNWNNASGTASGKASWHAVWDENARGQNGAIRHGRLELTSDVSAASVVTCNEKKYDSQMTAWARFAFDLLRGGGGAANLFK